MTNAQVKWYNKLVDEIIRRYVVDVNNEIQKSLCFRLKFIYF